LFFDWNLLGDEDLVWCAVPDGSQERHRSFSDRTDRRAGVIFQGKTRRAGMSGTGLDVFDKTLQTTNIWLDDLMGDEAVGPDKQLAWHLMAAVLRAVRNRLPVDLAAHLGSQLPILVRGAFYDQFQPSELPNRIRTLDEFLQGISAELEMARPVNVQEGTRAVFQILSRHVNRGQIEKVRQSMPEEVRAIWHDDPDAPDMKDRPARYRRSA
jgi:uncharacterized protein (DUF2267 family)